VWVTEEDDGKREGSVAILMIFVMIAMNILWMSMGRAEETRGMWFGDGLDGHQVVPSLSTHCPGRACLTRPIIHAGRANVEGAIRVCRVPSQSRRPDALGGGVASR
jgi:hypothetical protein